MGLSKENVLQSTGRGLAVFQHFFGTRYPGLKKPFLNPFYDDTKASCYLFESKDSGIVYFMDFGDQDFQLDCFGFVGKIFNLQCQGDEFLQILEIIDRELALGLAEKHDRIREVRRKYPELKVASELPPQTMSPKRKEVSTTYIPPVVKAYSPKELDWWRQYGIEPEILKRYRVASLKEFNGANGEGVAYTIVSTPSEPIFGYLGNGYVKAYRPFSKNRFFYGGNTKEGHVFGLDQLPLRGDTLFITGGEKDVLSLVSHGFHAICFNSESATIPKSLIRRLSFRFKHIVMLYDVDATGQKHMDKAVEMLKEYQVKKLLLPLPGSKNEKDISDFFRLGRKPEELLELFTDMLDDHYKETMSMLASCEIRYGNPPEPPESIITINEVSVGSTGNILAITGSEGSGKSNYLGALLAGTIAHSDVDIDTLGTDVSSNPTGSAVLFYDTEQSEAQLYKNVSQIVRRAKVNHPPTWFKTYGLVGMNRNDRLTSILHSMDRYYYEYGGIHLVVIDGVADLIDGVNDEESAVALIDELFRLAGIYKTVIICVLHLSPSGYKLRGHLGSEIQRKAAGILSIEKDDDKVNSVIKALKVRDGSPLDVPQLIIGWDEALKFHVLMEQPSAEMIQRHKYEELLKKASTIFDGNEMKSYSEIVSALEEVFSVNQSQAKNYLRDLKKFEILEQSDGRGSPYRLKQSLFLDDQSKIN
jgi:energy-coupling factor transporter ATP-binding protein EcfA2